MSDLVRRFSDAGQRDPALRPTTFWSWNDRLVADEVRRQVREMARGGLGGHFMHARRGLETPYLGPEWMEAVCAAIEEGTHASVTPWLYDEDCWPSGSCSGRVYAGREALRQKQLMFEEIHPPRWEPNETTIAVFVVRKNRGGEITAFRRLAEPRSAVSKTPAADEALLHFYHRGMEYVDVFNRDATQEFLKLTYERYAETIGGEFGRTIPGIFTDEPQYGGNGHRVPWSPELLKYFRRTCHYDLVDHLPELFWSVGPWRKTRYDFYQAVTRLFLLAWTMPVYQWCERHRLQLTGHMMGEETLATQLTWIGAAMPHYEYMHVPGIDHLGRGLSPALMMKQVSSAAAQLGRPRVLSEMFGGAGWNVSLDDLRWMAEWQFVLGVDLVCTHLSSLTLRGTRKTDFPPSLHHHQPWWPHYYLWTDYIASELAVLTSGQAVVDVLVIHPAGSAWAEFSPVEPEAVRVLDERLAGLVDLLLGMHVDFHFGDELMMERQAKVEGRTMRVGRRAYRTVIVPDATNLRANTVQLLAQFRKAGGAVIFAGRVPDLVDGEPSDKPARLAKGCKRVDVSKPRSIPALRRLLAPRLEVLTAGGKDAGSIVAQWRTDGDDHALIFLNTDEKKDVSARIRLPVAGRPARLDPATGESWLMKGETRGGRTTVKHRFGPRESLLVAVLAADSDEFIPEPPPGPPSRKMKLAGRWNVRRRDPNALVLDRASYRTDTTDFGPPMLVVDIQQELVQRGKHEVAYLRFEFDVRLKGLKGRRFEAVLEDPQAYEMWFNGMRTPLADQGPYWDEALRRVDVTPYLKDGANVIELKRPWLIDEARRAVLLGRTSGWEARTAVPNVEFEPIYLLGDFAVAFPGGTRQGPRGSRWLKGRPRLVDETPRLTGSDLARAGYPFFTGNLTLERDVVLKHEPSPDAVLELPAFSAITAAVHVNGQEAGVVWKPPRVVPVGQMLVKGRNHVAVTLATSLRNLLGPHHHEDGELHWVAPASFAGEKGWYGRKAGHRVVADETNVVDFGLAGDVVLRY
jgi:hypothetical protein